MKKEDSKIYIHYVALGACWCCRRKKMCPASSKGVQCNEFKSFESESRKEVDNNDGTTF